jgi:hypothetical protein
MKKTIASLFTILSLNAFAGEQVGVVVQIKPHLVPALDTTFCHGAAGTRDCLFVDNTTKEDTKHKVVVVKTATGELKEFGVANQYADTLKVGEKIKVTF